LLYLGNYRRQTQLQMKNTRTPYTPWIWTTVMHHLTLDSFFRSSLHV